MTDNCAECGHSADWHDQHGVCHYAHPERSPFYGGSDCGCRAYGEAST